MIASSGEMPHTVLLEPGQALVEGTKPGAVLLSGTKLYVGQEDGRITVHRLDSTEIVLTATASTKPVEQLGIIKELGSLVVLAGGNVALHELQTLSIQTTLQTITKGQANVFALDTSIGSAKNNSEVPVVHTTLAVASRRKLHVLQWHDSEWLDPLEVALPHQVRSLAFVTAKAVILGYSDNTYGRVDMGKQPTLTEFNVDVIQAANPAEMNKTITNTTSDKTTALGSLGLAGFGGNLRKGTAYLGIGGLGKVDRNLVVSTGRGEVIIVRNNTANFVSSTGLSDPSQSRVIEFPSEPLELVVCAAYAVTLIGPTAEQPLSNTLLVHSLHTLGLVQSVEVPPPFGRPNNAKDAPTIHIMTTAASNKGPVLIAARNNIYAYEMQPVSAQIDQMNQGGQYSDALALLEGVEDLLLPNKVQQRRELTALRALQLFRDRIPGRDGERDLDSAIDTFIELDINPAKVICLYPEPISGKLFKKNDEQEILFGGRAPELIRARVMTASPRPESIIDDVGSPNEPNTPIRRKKGLNLDAISPYRRSIYKDDDTASIKSNATRQTRRESVYGSPIVGRSDYRNDYKRSVEILLRYLTDRRQNVNKALSLLDNAHRPSPSDKIAPVPVADLFSIPDAPLSTLDPTSLHSVAQMVDTALFRSYLAIRPTLLGSLCRLDNWCEVEEVEGLLKGAQRYKELLDLYNGKHRHAEAIELLKTMAENEDDAHEKVAPLVAYLQTLGQSHLDLIFAASKWVFEIDVAAGTSIFTADREEVESLPRHAVAKHLASVNPQALQTYLERIIHSLGENGPEFHEKLAQSYVGAYATADADHKEEAQSRLIAFLHKSDAYRPERVLSHLSTGSMDNIRAILLGRLGKHEEALGIYVNRLKDEQAAELYCARVYDRDKTSPVFLILLKMYLQPSQGTPRLEPALHLLHHYGSKMALNEATQLLPPLLSVQQVSRFLMESAKKHVEERNSAKMLVSASKARLDQVSRAKVVLESQHVTITNSRACPVCHKRIGTSVIALRMPDGVVTHYQCRQRLPSLG